MELIDKIFKMIPGLQNWIENTSLFNTIKKYAGTGVEIHAIPNEMRLYLTGVSGVETVRDLPVELIAVFYLNSPFFKPAKAIEIQGLITLKNEKQ